MAAIIDIAEAVKEELNGGSFSQEFTARRHYQPVFDLPEMKTLHVTVVPKGYEEQIANRSQTIKTVKVDVAVQKKLSSMDNAEIDPLDDLVEEIMKFFRLRRLTGYPQAVWELTENDPVYSREHMEEMRLFTSVVTLTYRVTN